MKKLIILRGNSGSGKTTIAKALQDKYDKSVMMISQDTVRRDILKEKDGANTLTLSLMKELLVYGYKNRELVILEGIMYSRWYKQLFELAVKLYKTEIFAYYFDLTFEETFNRHRTKPNCDDFGEEDMKRWWKEKDFSDILNESIITNEKDKESIVNDIYNCVMNKKG